MLRQSLINSSRALSATVRIASQTPLARTQFRIAAPLASVRTAQPTLSRWYSDEAKKEPAKDAAEEQAAAEGAGAEEAAKKELETKNKEVLEWKDKYLRSVADFRNLQDRTSREMKQARDFAIQKFAKDLVDSVDNLDRALAMVPEEKLNAEEKTGHLQDLVSLYDGLKMTESILMQTLKKHGLERFDPEGEKFDPNEHEATFMTPMQDKENNTVFHVQQKGFKLNGRVLRAAKVGVVKN
ncbi:uncharacterized protein E0L32_006351 [Thyridium curvatum]|uniref:GrpE protein homolog n=1 Tax=Thyridium curvatum TaxID=1093900 RepID=A0A507B7U8_9PEZI|nr:uncharacterized protein E0L32_006351 [Thyridium curvatum]TPX13151.1 hypothetical protein E0L32_006351 [Thyridium curvatum]